jgi:hypothetical protein
VRVSEHQLQAGDVIRIGDTQLLYVTDEDKGNASAHTTQTLPPVSE